MAGSLLTPDPADETVALARARAEEAAAEAALHAGEDREALAGRPKDITD